MLEIEVVEQDARSASSILLLHANANNNSHNNNNEPNRGGDHRQCLSTSGGALSHHHFDYNYHPTKQQQQHATTSTKQVVTGVGMMVGSSTSTTECSGMSSCSNTSVTTRSTADVTASSCDSSLSRGGDVAGQLILEESLEISAVDTHTSILNITEDEEFDDDEDDDSDEEEDQPEDDQQQQEEDEPLLDACQFEEAHPDSDFAPHSSSFCTNPESTATPEEEGRCIPAGKTGLSFMENFVESFVENLCFSNKKKEPSDHPQEESGPAVVPANSQAQDVLEKLERDMTTVLGCLGPDSVHEMKHAQCMLHHLLCSSNHHHHHASSDYASARPRRNTKRQRMRRLQKLQEERGRDGLNVLAVRSMQDLSCSSSSNKHLDDSGYDSDPDDVLLVSSSPFNKMNEQRSPSPSSVTSFENPQDWQDNLHPIVQESLNSVWDLTWHQPSSFSSLATCSTPVRVTAWMERGTIIKNNSVMIEPRLMWKASSSNTPECIPLMHVCRVIPADGCLDRIQHPLARPSTSYLVRTTTANRHSSTRDYLFQAASVAERNDLVHRWKVTVARFATLAVLEDAETLLKEFFVTASAFPAPLRTSSVCC